MHQREYAVMVATLGKVFDRHVMAPLSVRRVIRVEIIIWKLIWVVIVVIYWWRAVAGVLYSE
jgi:hypothetical protein